MRCRPSRPVYTGKHYLDTQTAQCMARRQSELSKKETPFDRLTERVLQNKQKNTTPQKLNQISEQRKLSPKTATWYRYRMFSKLNIHGDVELTHLAIRHGLCNAETLTSQ
ncbi:hypothetical protein ISU91_19205 [Leptospira borgpetersenii serovar Hardjo-bovis]|nr:hypothetical protein [Leptospira borgpetersenii serovar Hardjo-bovis]